MVATPDLEVTLCSHFFSRSCPGFLKLLQSFSLDVGCFFTLL